MTKGFVVAVRERRGKEGDRNNKLGWNLLNKYLLCRIEFAIAMFTGVRSIFCYGWHMCGELFFRVALADAARALSGKQLTAAVHFELSDCTGGMHAA